jgi:hypothetical protein
VTRELERVLVRDLAAMRREIVAYAREADVWATPDGIANPAGNLALHAAGNLSHFVGAVLGGSGYVRDREAELGARDVPRAEILAALEAAEAAVRETLPRIPAERLAEPYPVEIGGTRLSISQFLVHLTTHLAYHLGQVDYHRRLVTGDAATVTAMSIPALAEDA